jgi:NADH-quinone oxidoreductase subunit A
VLTPSADPSDPLLAVWPLALFALVTVGTFAAMLLASWLLGERRAHAGAVPYESGIQPTSRTGIRSAPHFYLMGMLFVVFDVEAAFLFAWAVAVREAGWAGLVEVVVFVGVLLVSLVWLARVGALDWGSTTRQVRHPPPTRKIVAAPPAVLVRPALGER